MLALHPLKILQKHFNTNRSKNKSYRRMERNSAISEKLQSRKKLGDLYKSNKLHGVKEVKLLFEDRWSYVKLQKKIAKKGQNVEMKVAISYEGGKSRN